MNGIGYKVKKGILSQHLQHMLWLCISLRETS